MADNHFRSRDRSPKHWPHRNSGGEIAYLLRAEEELLQSMSAGTPLPEVLHKICNALNLEIGNMISLISLADDHATDRAAIARIAALFGLYVFCSAGVVAENDELLGSLEMYCCVPHSPSPGEFQLIKRATCLAAMAIKQHNEADPHGYCCIRGNRSVRKHLDVTGLFVATQEAPAVGAMRRYNFLFN
jgi:hypothetical protein